MAIFTQTDITRLLQSPCGDCVSLYMGMDPDPQKFRESTTRLMNLLNYQLAASTR